MKKLSLLFTLFALLTASPSYGWVIKESKQDEDVKIIVNDGGIFREAISVDAANSQTVITGDGSSPPTLKVVSGGNSRITIDSTGSTADLVLARRGSSPGSVAMYTSNGSLAFSSGGADPDAPFTTTVGSVSGTGSWNLGNSSVTAQARPSHVIHLTGNSGSSNVIARNSTALANTESTEMQIQQGSGGANDRAGIGHYKDSGLTATAGYIMLREHDDGQDWLWVDSSGVFRISATKSSVGTAGGTVVGTQTSDRRLKTDIRDYEGGLDVIQKLRPSRYKFYDGKEHVGFIAQDVEKIVPEAVIPPSDDNEWYRMEGRELIPALVNAIKQQQAMIEKLQSDIEAMR